MIKDHKIRIAGVIELRELMLVSVFSIPDQPGSAGNVLTFFGEKNISVDFITESRNLDGFADLNFCLSRQSKTNFDRLLQQLAKIIPIKDIKVTEPVAILSFYGPHFREKPAIAGTIFSSLGEAGINILGISTSVSSVCCVIQDDKVDIAHEVISQNFDYPE
jgi:aspartokinase